MSQEEAIRTYERRYLQTRGNGRLDATGEQVQNPEKFQFVDLGGYVALWSGVNRRYVGVREWDGTVIADATTIGRRQIFTLEDLGEDRFALRAHHGKFLRAEPGGALLARADTVGDPETFTRVRLPLGGTMQAWAIPLVLAGENRRKAADHTWVTSNDGKGWACMGDPEYYEGKPRWNGNDYIAPDRQARKLGSGAQGSADAAQAIFERSTELANLPVLSLVVALVRKGPRPFPQAGIVYSVNGVCHQIANRILYPSRQIVSGARGYWFSSLTYGTYGTRAFATNLYVQVALSVVTASEWRETVAESAAAAPPVARVAVPQDRQAEDEYLRRLHAMHLELAPPPLTAPLATASPAQVALMRAQTASLYQAELDVSLRYRLGDGFDADKLQRVRDLYMDHAGYGTEASGEALLAAAEEAPPVPAGPGYAEHLNEQHDALTDAVADEIDHADYFRLFGEEPGTRIQLVDPDLLEKV